MTVELPGADQLGAVGVGMGLIRSLVGATRELAAHPDVLTPSPRTEALADAEDAEGLVRAVLDATAWLSGAVARVGAGVEARVFLDAADQRREASLVVTFRGETVDLHARAELPAHVEAFALTPQRGLRALLQQVVELRLNDVELDRAYVIAAATTSAATLLACRLELLRLAERSASVTSDAGWLEVRIRDLPHHAVDVADAAGASLELWRRLAAGT